MKKILFIFTGGTIGSTVCENYISTDENKPYMLIDGYIKRYGDIGEYDTISPYFVLSENLNGNHISMLIDAVRSKLNDDYCGIIVTHGTDTLAYSSSALGYALGNKTIPVCFVSANYPLEDVRTNGYENLHGAVKFIRNVGKNGVWVSYKNNGDNIKIHRGTRLCPHGCFSDSVFSVKDAYYGHFNEKGDFCENPAFEESEDNIPPIAPKLKERCESVMKISSYPGMVYPEIPLGVKYIIWESYHSGTIDTSSSVAKEFFEDLKNRNVRVFLTGCVDGIWYESTSLYSLWGLIPLCSVSPIAAYVKLWLLTCSNRDESNEISHSLGGDIVV